MSRPPSAARPRALLALCGLLVSLPACALENPDHLEDTAGAQTGWTCDGGRCRTVRETFSPLPPGCGFDDTEFLVGAGPIALLCAVSVDADGEDVVHPATCRPLRCSDGLDCPQYAAREYGCIRNICQIADADGARLDRLDLTGLCLFETPRHATCAEADADPLVQRRLAEIEAVCGEEFCDGVPEGCLEP